jgi:hypothetical protein
MKYQKERPTSKLTIQLLQELKARGFLFVQVKAVRKDKRADYIEPHFLLLLPVKELPKNQEQKEIYEPTDSKLLAAWAGSENEGIEVLVATVK